MTKRIVDQTGGRETAATVAQAELSKAIEDTKPGDPPVTAPLKTSERVIRRVTDGIYREPWSALRELISNAYDADATRVVITSDPPRFARIAVRDDGNGFTSEALASMCLNIGGSPKRTPSGSRLGVTSTTNPELSPGGRRLIGKLGIGLFAVSQLTQQFRIITKVAGAAERTVADVILFRYAEPKTGEGQPGQAPAANAAPGGAQAAVESRAAPVSNPDAPDELEVTGEVQISKLPASDLAAHGTDVIVENLLPRTRDEFRSRDMWEFLKNPPTDVEEPSIQKPAYHIGYADPLDEARYSEPPCVPWKDSDNALVRFEAVADAMFSRSRETHDRRPSLVSTFDNYLRFVWLLSLSCPVAYLEEHPFDLTLDSGLRFFELGSMNGGQATEIHLRAGETLRQRLRLSAPEHGSSSAFIVTLDGLEIRRPIRFTRLPTTSNQLKTPMLFVGRDEPEMTRYDKRRTGGTLRFEGYLLWAPRVVPQEHNGVLVRVAESSGSLFDETFMKYQISEQTRREQVTAELFVHEGMDAALNIDRESFNQSHPHYQYLAAWVHDAFKQFATKHKAVGSEVRTHSLGAARSVAASEFAALVASIVEHWSSDEPPTVEFVHEGAKPSHGSLAFADTVIFEGVDASARATHKFAFDQKRLAALVQLLYCAGLLDHLSHVKRLRLVRDLGLILRFPESE